MMNIWETIEKSQKTSNVPYQLYIFFVTHAYILKTRITKDVKYMTGYMKSRTYNNI